MRPPPENDARPTPDFNGSGGISNVKRVWRGLPCADHTHEEALRMTELLEPGNKKKLIVLMLGGVTMTELAAMRWIASSHGRELLVATTQLLSGDKLMHQLLAPEPAVLM